MPRISHDCFQAVEEIAANHFAGRDGAIAFETIARVWHAEAKELGRSPKVGGSLYAIGAALGLDIDVVHRINNRSKGYALAGHRAMVGRGHLHGGNPTKWVIDCPHTGKTVMVERA